MKNKKGILGLETSKGVILSLLVLAVIAISIMAVLPVMQSSVDTIDTRTGAKNNETTTAAVTEKGVALSVNTLRNCLATVSIVTNATGLKANSGNYTVSGCTIYSTGDGYSNNSIWNVTYTYTYDTNAQLDVVNNVSGGVATFFTYMPTIFTLLGVVVIILVIAILIIAVSRFGMGGMSMSSGRDEYI